MESVAPKPISVVIIAQDEQDRVGDAVRSCEPFADEILVVDGGSRDATAQVARDLGCRVLVNPWPGFAAQRNFGAESADHDWILFIDADEIVGDELAAELLEWKRRPATRKAYGIYRIRDFLGVWLPGEERHLPRLYDRRDIGVKDVLVHEGPDVAPRDMGRFEGVLWHHNFRSVHQEVAKFNRYTDLEAQKMHGEGRAFSLPRLVLRPPAKFAQKYLLHGMYKRGVAGLAMAVMWSYYEFLRQIKLYEILWKKRS